MTRCAVDRICQVACATSALLACSAWAEPPSAADSSRERRAWGTPLDDSSGGAPTLEAEDSEAEEKVSSLPAASVQRMLARYAKEPTALQVAAAALRAAERDPGRYAAMAQRARLRGLVPSVALGARRGQGVDLRSTATEDEVVRFTAGDDLVLSATLRFELGRLMFAGEELAITREARAARSARLELARSVIHWYFVRRRLLLERDLLGHTSLTREMRIAEIEALLDTFTNGAFGRMISGRRTAWTTGASTHASERP